MAHLHSNSSHKHLGPVPLFVFFCLTLFISGSVNAQQARCPSTEIEDVEAWLEEAEALISLVDYTAALDLLSKAENRLPCAQGPVSTDSLTRLFVVRGVTHFYLESEEASIQAFSKALAISPALQWDANLGKRAKVPFDAASQQNGTSPAQSTAVPSVKGDVDLLVDGIKIAGETELALIPGLHLVQVHPQDAEWWGLIFTVHSGVQSTVPVPEFAMAPPEPALPSVVVEVEPEPTPETTAQTVDLGSPAPQYNYKVLGGVGLSTAGFVAFTVGGTRYWSTRKELESDFTQLPADAVDEAMRDALFTQHKRAARIANIGLGAFVIGAGISTTFLILDGKTDTATSLRPYFIPGEGGLALSGQF